MSEKKVIDIVENSTRQPDWINHSVNNIACDIDQTLLMWIEPKKKGKNKIEMIYAGKKVYLTPHEKHVDLIRHWAQEGYTIYAWSGNGPNWAAEAIKKLGLKDCIYHIMGKFTKFVDDLPAEQILGTRVYLEYGNDKR